MQLHRRLKVSVSTSSQSHHQRAIPWICSHKLCTWSSLPSSPSITSFSQPLPNSPAPPPHTDASDEQCFRFSDCASCTANSRGCQWCEDRKCISASSNCTVVSVRSWLEPPGRRRRKQPAKDNAFSRDWCWHETKLCEVLTIQSNLYGHIFRTTFKPAKQKQNQTFCCICCTPTCFSFDFSLSVFLFYSLQICLLSVRVSACCFCLCVAEFECKSVCVQLTLELARQHGGALSLSPPPSMLSEHQLSLWKHGARRRGHVCIVWHSDVCR